MGRDKPKKYKNMGYFEKEAYKDEMAKKLGIQGTEYRDSRGNTQTRRNDKALKAAIKNNFDYRTSAQHMDGVKGKANFNDYNKYERAAVKLHKKAGNGGKYSSNEDITTVTKNLVRDSEREFRDELDAKYATANQLNALQDKIKQRAEGKTPAEPVELSKSLSNAQNSVEDFDKGALGQQGSMIFGKIGKGNDLEQATDEVMSSEASGDGKDKNQDYKDAYAFNVKGGLKLSGIATRGPNSGLKGEGF